MGLDFDPEVAVSSLSMADSELRRLIERVGPLGLQPQTMHSPFAALLRSIVFQQLSGKVANVIHGRVLQLVPKGRRLTPQLVLGLSDETLRAAGLSRAKILAAKDLAAKAAAGQVPSWNRLRTMSDEEIIERLVQIRGIGPWTVEMLLIFRLGRPDVLPVSDLGVRRGFMLTFQMTDLPSADELRSRAERWRPYRSAATWYLWRAVDLERGGENQWA